MVLLENRDALPFREGDALALYGGGACFTVKGGTGSGMVNNRYNISVWEGLRQAGFRILTEDYLTDYRRRYQEERDQWIESLYRMSSPGDFFSLYRAFSANPMQMPQGGSIEKKNTDTALYVISRISGEGADRKAAEGDYYLSETERRELATVCSLYKRTIVVLNVGGVMDLSFLDHMPVSAVILMMQAGQEGGNALADVLLGKTAPSGRLTDTWAYRYEDYPSSAEFSHNNGNLIEEKYKDGIFVGYRYFDSFQVKPRYPFGYGLSYTTFEVCPGEVSVEGQNVLARVIVRNTGRFASRQVVQLFAYLPQEETIFARKGRELRRLVAFAKTGTLMPSEEESLTLTFSVEALTSYHTAGSEYYLDAGRYLLEAVSCDASCSLRDGEDQDREQLLRTPLCVLTLDRPHITEKLSPICPLLDSLEEIVPETMPVWKASEDLPELPLETAVERLKAEKASRKPYEVSELQDPGIIRILEQMSTLQKAKLVCGAPKKDGTDVIGNASAHVPGAAGETTGELMELGVRNLILADGPAGLRLQQHYQEDPEDHHIYSMNRYEMLENRFFGKEFLHEGAIDHYQFLSAIPIGTLLAQSYDPALLEEAGAMISEEMKEIGVHLWLAPGMNIHRNPLCGRNFEYYSEDPYVSGCMAGAITKGVQRNRSCGTTIKHFACNNQEENRFGVSSVVSERALREIYLKGFEIAVKEAQPMAIMSSYNRVNAVHTANSYDLLTTAARKEWGFEGIIMTDWTTTNSGHGSSAAKCIAAGNDLIMPGTPSDIREITEAVEGKYDQWLPEECLDICAARMIRMIEKLNG